MVNVSETVALLGKGKGAKFATIVARAKGTGEVAKHMVILGAHTENIYRKDRESLAARIESGEFTGVALVAATEILASLDKSLDAMSRGEFNSDYALKDVRKDASGIPGVWFHKETGKLYVQCVTESKTIITPGEYKTVKSSDKTLAKKEIEKKLRKSHIRTFIIEKIGELRAKGERLEIEEALD